MGSHFVLINENMHTQKMGLKVMVGPIIVAAVVVFILIMFFSFVPVGLWISRWHPECGLAFSH